MQTIKKLKSGIFLYVLCAYGYVWILFIVLWLNGWSVSYDPQQWGGKLLLAAILAPLFGAVVATMKTEGIKGLREFFAGVLHLHFNPIWCAAAVIIPAIVFTLSIVVTRLIDGVEMSDNLFAPEFPLAFLIFFLIYNGLGEEVGWRGYALPRLQEKFGSLTGSVILGIIWALWHIPLFIVPGSSQYGSSLPGYIWLLVCWSVIMTVIVNKANGSVWVAIIFHEARQLFCIYSKFSGTLR